MGADTTEAGEPITAEPIEKLSENSSVKLVDGAWFDRAVVYHIYPLGYCGAPQYNEGEKTQGSRILKVLDRIGHLKALGSIRFISDRYLNHCGTGMIPRIITEPIRG